MPFASSLFAGSFGVTLFTFGLNSVVVCISLSSPLLFLSPFPLLFSSLPFPPFILSSLLSFPTILSLLLLSLPFILSHSSFPFLSSYPPPFPLFHPPLYPPLPSFL